LVFIRDIGSVSQASGEVERVRLMSHQGAMSQEWRDVPWEDMSTDLQVFHVEEAASLSLSLVGKLWGNQCEVLTL
jgi:hypothetical protein